MASDPKKARRRTKTSREVSTCWSQIIPSNPPPKSGFGEHLRREREMRGVSLEEITTATRIGPRFLQALENEKWDELPGGVFNRGFVKAIAHYLGIDEEALLGEYTLATGDAGTPSAVVARVPHKAPTRPLPVNAPKMPWITWVLTVVVIAAILGGGFYLWRRHVAKRNTARPPAVVTTSADPVGGAH